jgi:hypothetical protein
VNYVKSRYVAQHIETDKHQNAKSARSESVKKQLTLAQALKLDQLAPGTVLPSTLAPSHLAYVLTVITRFLRAGIELTKLAEVADLLSDKHPAVPSAHSNLQLYIPYIFQTERKRLAALLKTLPCGLCHFFELDISNISLTESFPSFSTERRM